MLNKFELIQVQSQEPKLVLACLVMKENSAELKLQIIASRFVLKPFMKLNSSERKPQQIN